MYFCRTGGHAHFSVCRYPVPKAIRSMHGQKKRPILHDFTLGIMLYGLQRATLYNIMCCRIQSGTFGGYQMELGYFILETSDCIVTALVSVKGRVYFL